MRKSLITILATFVASASPSEAVFVSFATGGARGHQFLLSDGTTRVVTTTTDAVARVSVGYLTVPGESSSFVEFANTTINNPLSSAPIGGFVNTQTGNNATQATVDALKGKQIALWVYGQGGQQGLFTSANWTVPQSITTEVDSSYDVVLGILPPPNVAVPPVVTTVAIAGFNPAQFIQPVNITVNAVSNANGASYILGAPIPEPGSIGLMALAALFTLRRRR